MKYFPAQKKTRYSTRRREYKMLEWPAFIKFEVQKTATTASPTAGIASTLKSKFTIQPHRSKLMTARRTKSPSLMPAVSLRKERRFILGMKSRIAGQRTGCKRN